MEYISIFTIIRVTILAVIYTYIIPGTFTQDDIDKMMDEGLKMKKFSHPNVLSLIGVCVDGGPAPYIVMPFMINGSLLAYLKKERGNLIVDSSADEDQVCMTSYLITVTIMYRLRKIKMHLEVYRIHSVCAGFGHKEEAVCHVFPDSQWNGIPGFREICS